MTSGYTEEVSAPMRYRDLDTALRGQASARVLVLAGHAGHDAVTGALRTSLAAFTGSVRLDNTFPFVVGQVH